MKIKTWVLTALGIILTIVLVIVSLNWSRNNVSDLMRVHNSKMSPVIMIPGSSATENRFDTLVKKLNKNNRNPHSLIKVKVTTDDKLHFSGRLRQGDNEPIIVVAFENNHDGYSNIKKQARWFNIAFKQLTKQYNFNNFKGIGHSNGGLIYTAFLENYYSSYSNQIKIKQLMTIGSPYNFNEKSVHHKTQMLSDFIEDKKKIPTSLSVYFVAGTETYNSDGLVPLGSVMAGKYIYQGQVKHFTTISVSGSDAQHSDLPQNDQIIDLINRYILDPQQKPQGRQGQQGRQDSHSPDLDGK
ncbi:alpha/beta hydrolase [Companilactobacillus kimchiensis]|uniref:Cell surface hydrolase n=1 Tax=Companilactobacillus kimchiensis TaxID=993692 RepID=A0A0R2LMX7_9LACO|nr:alpha/beta hydrolase [Companilactobacillus kimchiensis]KRO00784.1 cell surface hydrolase [Companilactobacillus kimchiensis]